MADQYQEGQIAEDGNGNFVVYRDGQWYPSNERGFPLERIPRNDYGAGHFQLPNGDIVRAGRNGGQTVVERAEGGGSAGATVSADQRGRYQIGANPLVRAERNLAIEEANGNPLNRDWLAVALNAVDLDPRGDTSFRPLAPLANVIGGQDYQNAQQALSTYEASLLPIQSGASVTASEAARQIRADFPSLGDSPETLRRKAANRMDRINAILAGIGREPAFTAEEIENPSLRTEVKEIDALSGIQDAASQPDRTNGPGLPVRDYGGGDDEPQSPVTEGYRLRPGDSLTPDWLRAAGIDPERFGTDVPYAQGELKRLGFQQVDGEWVRPSSRAAQPNQVRTEAAQERTDQGEGIVRKIDAFAGGALDTITFGTGDELAAGLNTVIPLEPGAASIWDTNAGDAFTRNLGLIRGRNDADARDVPVSRASGQVAGAFVPGTSALGFARAGGSLGANALRGAVAGSAAGSAYGYGSAEGNAVDRLDDAAGGAVVGGIVGGAAPFVPGVGRAVDTALGNAPSRVSNALVSRAGSGVGRVGEALRIPGATTLRERFDVDPLQGALSRLGSRLGPERVNALSSRAQNVQDLGIDPTLIDALDDGGRGIMRAVGSGQNAARDDLVGFAESRRANLPTRVRTIAREEISDDTRPALDIIDSQRTIRRQNAAAMDDFANDVVPLNADLSRALGSDLARSAIVGAARRAESAIDPVEAAAAQRLSAIASGNASATGFTVREAQDISKALNDAATAAYRNGSPDGPVLSDLARTIRGNARDSSEGYRNWLTQYGEDSDLIEAATRGRNFVSVSNDPVNARSTEQFIRDASGAQGGPGVIQRAVSREAVETAASNPTSARSVLTQLAGDVDQARRADALGLNSDRIRARAQGEIDALTAAQRSSPRIGSESSVNLADQGSAGSDLVEMARRPLAGTAAVLARRFQARGFNEAESNALIRAAIDPTQTRQLIEMLNQRMPRREARNLARAITYQLQQGEN